MPENAEVGEATERTTWNPFTVERAVELACDAIDHDDRRHPYGHHQNGREFAKKRLRDLLNENERLRQLVDADG